LTARCGGQSSKEREGERLARLGFGQVAFPYDAFVRLVDTLDPILVLAGTLRQRLGDHKNTAGGGAADWGQELYELADAKFMV